MRHAFMYHGGFERNYPDLRLFRPEPKRALRQDSFVFLYPGTLNWHQGLDIAVNAVTPDTRIIDALRLMADKGIGAVLLMQYVPFCDKEAVGLLHDFEQSVYRNL